MLLIYQSFISYFLSDRVLSGWEIHRCLMIKKPHNTWLDDRWTIDMNINIEQMVFRENGRDTQGWMSMYIWSTSKEKCENEDLMSQHEYEKGEEWLSGGMKSFTSLSTTCWQRQTNLSRLNIFIPTIRFNYKTIVELIFDDIVMSLKTI